jgi:hypothetical protein
MPAELAFSGIKTLGALGAGRWQRRVIDEEPRDIAQASHATASKPPHLHWRMPWPMVPMGRGFVASWLVMDAALSRSVRVRFYREVACDAG